MKGVIVVDKIGISNIKLYINGKKLAELDKAILAIEHNKYTYKNTKIIDEFTNKEFEFDFKFADKKLNKYYWLMSNSKSLRIREKNYKKYHKRLKEKYGVMLGLQ